MQYKGEKTVKALFKYFIYLSRWGWAECDVNALEGVVFA